MARTVATNFTGGLQFPYATAAADLFHKEDVQTLALAVDQHTHAAGLGLPIATIPASAIPDGSITSAKIADNTIQTADIADGAITSAKILDGTISALDLAVGAVTNLLGAYQATPSFSTTTVSSSVATPVGVTGTPSGLAGAYVLTTCSVILSHSAGPSATVYMGIARDGVVIGTWQAVYYNVLAGETRSFFVQTYEASPSGSHTWALYVFPATAGTTTLSTFATMQVQEIKR